MKQTLENIFYSCASQLLSLLVPLLTAPYISRILGSQNLGIFSYVESVSQIVIVVGLIGLGNYSIREIAYVKDDKKLRSTIFFELVLLRILLVVITSLTFIFLLKGTEFEYYAYYQLIFIMGSFLDITWFFSGIEDFKTVVLSKIVVKTASIVAIFWFIKSADDLTLYFIIMGISQLTAVIVCYPRIRKFLSFPDIKSLNIVRHIMPTLSVALPQIVILIYYQMDKVMLQYFTRDNAVIALYDQADKIVKVPVTIITAISAVMFPKTSSFFNNKEFEKMEENILLTIKYGIMLIIPMTLGLASIAQGFISWFLGTGFEEVGTIIMALSPVIIARGLSTISSNQYLVSTKNTKVLTMSSVVSAILSVILNVLLIPLLGVYGAVIGTVIAEFSVAFIQYRFMSRDIKYNGLILLAIKYTIFSSLSIFVSKIFGRAFSNSITGTLIEICITVIVYLFLLLISKDDLLNPSFIKKI